MSGGVDVNEVETRKQCHLCTIHSQFTSVNRAHPTVWFYCHQGREHAMGDECNTHETENTCI